MQRLITSYVMATLMETQIAPAPVIVAPTQTAIKVDSEDEDLFTTPNVCTYFNDSVG